MVFMGFLSFFDSGIGNGFTLARKRHQTKPESFSNFIYFNQMKVRGKKKGLQIRIIWFLILQISPPHCFYIPDLESFSAKGKLHIQKSQI